QRIQPKSKQKKVITNKEIEDIIAKIARIPAKSVASDERNALKSLDRDLKAVVFGQDKAIDTLAAAIKMARSGLGNPQKPIGSFLFSGPTGVGKTEVARQLAYTLGVELIRFDMSEYMERHAVSRLIGAPPGYVGFEQGGLLTEAITKHPYAVLLLDEIEKAHPDIFNMLLQIMEEGRLTDSFGRHIDFRNVVLIMTSNIGANLIKNSTGLGFGKSGKEQGADKMREMIQGEIERHFRPEFINRLDEIVVFNQLTRDDMQRIVENELAKVNKRMKQKGHELAVDQSVIDWLIEKSFHEDFGARPLKRGIEKHLEDPLSEQILRGELETPYHIKATIKDGEVSFEIEKLPQKPKAEAGAKPGDAAGGKKS
ncbi:MAG: hypothetical protein RL398_1652, partial [Planctomycetota bacterium]